MFLSLDNHFTAKGRLTREPLANYSDKGNLVTSITIAQKTPFKDSNGEPQIAYITYTAIDTGNNKIATNLADFATKGSPITLEGYMDSYSKVDSQTGEIIYTEIKRISSFRVEESKQETAKRREKNNTQK
ncbi:single-stranded DNA-binding protein [Enterococcus faecalis]|jgi:single-strand DNA-binding protein|uniref:single-stranded DNA-binding protein n=1 Tax=Enterococcus TaxID=1350 RepID=UPI002A74A877|nr:single-stranded DNA-binding protein [Enterococcus faecalis]EME7220449.1 single-stranded DNA-binding protein [Enterococcus faecium]MDY2553554.1 single-stranded DNA-binding protein [Enterococcus faecalis]HDA6121889.1 single-stranded DNA-binding protein [Enterococcus faecium]